MAIATLQKKMHATRAAKTPFFFLPFDLHASSPTTPTVFCSSDAAFISLLCDTSFASFATL